MYAAAFLFALSVGRCATDRNDAVARERDHSCRRDSSLNTGQAAI
jgi:hypothetical protein